MECVVGGEVATKTVNRRWAVLAVLCMSLVIVSLSNTSLNVALPTLARTLHASPADLQWIVDAYSLVFAGLLLTAGALGDRVGPRRALNFGLVIFGAASTFAAFSRGVVPIIVARGLMGVGAAFVMPATLSILARVFPPAERNQAIAIWAGVAGVGGATGSILTGWLLLHFWWGSAFVANVVATIVALVAGALFVPPAPPLMSARAKPDLLGPILSSAGVAALIYATIAAPSAGWLSSRTAASSGVGAALLAAFVYWELVAERPMFDIRHFANRGFSAAATTITVIFFTMYGTVFLVTQYLQLVNGLTPMQAGLRLLPLPLAFLIAAPLSAPAVRRCGNARVVRAGLSLLAAGALLMSRLGLHSNELVLAGALATMATGMGMTTAPSTSVIMGRLRADQAGSGSAINDTTREFGGSLGVAVLGSVVTTIVGHSATSASGMAGLLAGRGTRATRLAFVHAVDVTMASTAGLLVVAAVSLSVVLRRAQRRARLLLLPRIPLVLQPSRASPQETTRESLPGRTLREPLTLIYEKRDSEMDHSAEATVLTLLRAAGISPSREEVAELSRAYPQFRSALDRLHEVDEARYEAPALYFQAVPPGPAWRALDSGTMGLVGVTGEDSV